MNEPTTHRSPMRRHSALLVLVALVFAILLFSFTVSGATLVMLIRAGVVAPFSEGTMLGAMLFLLLFSLAIGTVFSAIGGTLFLRPLRRIIAANKQVAGGDFTVRVEPAGPYEMQRLARSFNDMTRELGSIETIQNDFVSNVSHEFKTPLASIRGFARLLKRDTLTAAQRNEYLDIILFEAERLGQLSGNVLLLSNLDNTDSLPDTAAFPLDEQLRQCVLVLAPQLEIKQLEVVVECEPITLAGSEEMLRQVWLNLLGNAIKFTPEGGTITVAAVGGEATAIVTVSDTGIGMDDEVQSRLFDRFYQGDASHATRGNGLGLALAQRIVALSGGSIKVESTPGQGSAFTVTLPRHAHNSEGDDDE